MKNDKETREKLLVSAKQEFLEKGYMQASLRNICKNAGVTTGALYFFFQDKEDLFASLVQEPLGMLYQLMSSHYQEETNMTIPSMESIEDFGDDLEVARQALRFMYRFYDEFQLILTKSQGSKFEHCVDKFVEITEKHYRYMGDKIAEQLQTEKFDDYMIHWVAHTQIQTFVHILTHEKNEEEGIRHLEPIIQYIIAGWIGMFTQGRKSKDKEKQ